MLFTAVVLMTSSFIGGCIEDIIQGEPILSQISRLEWQITPILVGFIGGLFGYFYGKRIENHKEITERNIPVITSDRKQTDMDFQTNKEMNLIIESERKYQMLVENMKEGVLLEDTDGIITFVNPGLC
ncbi:unnamed protein product, partial [marine sediment metagenome]